MEKKTIKVETEVDVFITSDNRQGILDFTTQFNPYPALVPPMTWATQSVRSR